MKKYMSLVLALIIALAMMTGAVSALAEDVTLYVVDINADHETYAAMIDAFEAAHPGVKVETNHAVNDSAEVMSALIAAGNTPNVFVSTPEQVAVYGEYLYDWAEDTEALDLYTEEYIEAVTRSDGTIKGLPFGTINVGLVYNKDILAEAGYDSIPLTISGFEKMCADIDEKTGVVPFALATSSLFIPAQMLDAYIISKDLPGSAAGAKFDAGECKVSEANPNYSNFFRMMDVAKTYTDNETLGSYDWEYICNLMANGKVAVITYGDWSYNAITSFNADVNLGFSSYPVSEDEAEAVTPTSVNEPIMLFKDVENFELARELAMFLGGSAEAANYMAVGYGCVACAKAREEVDPALFNPLLLQAAQLAAEGRTVDRMQNYYPTAAGADFMGNAGAVIQGYVIGLYEEADAIAEIDTYWPVSK